MKTYQSSTNEKRKNFFKRHWHVLVVVASVIVIAVAVTLSVVLTLPRRSEPVADDPIINNPDPPPTNTVVVTPPAVVLPVSGCQVGLGYAIDKLVYWDTLELWRTHTAMDFVGDSDVVAVRDGTVTSVDMHTVLDGNVITITHDDGYVSVYKSLGDEITVKVGDTVKAGTKIGVTSDSMLSELNTGAHLHFELKQNGAFVDPSAMLPINQDK